MAFCFCNLASLPLEYTFLSRSLMTLTKSLSISHSTSSTLDSNSITSHHKYSHSVPLWDSQPPLSYSSMAYYFTHFSSLTYFRIKRNNLYDLTISLSLSIQTHKPLSSTSFANSASRKFVLNTKTKLTSIQGLETKSPFALSRFTRTQQWETSIKQQQTWHRFQNKQCVVI